MEDHNRTPPRQRIPQSIPLRDLSRPPDGPTTPDDEGRLEPRHGRARSLLTGLSPASNYSRLQGDSPTRGAHDRYHSSGEVSPLGNVSDFAAASVGLSLGPTSFSAQRPTTPPSGMRRPTIVTTAANDDEPEIFSPPETDTTPLTDKRRLNPLENKSALHNRGQRHDRERRRSSVHWVDGASSDRGRSSRLGDNLPTLDTSYGVQRKSSASSGISRLEVSSADRSDAGSRSRSRSPSPSPMARANSMLREMSQRVVNLSNDTDFVERSIRRRSTVKRSRPSSIEDENEISALPDIEAYQQSQPQLEKTPSVEVLPPILPPPMHPNPLRGNSFKIFGPENPVRKGLCEVLVHPLTEPIILVLIVIQTVMLAVNAAPDAVYHQSRAEIWGTSKFDYGILGLFIIYTFEAVARSIVSGFISNPYEYSTLDRSMGLREAVLKKAHGLFAPHTQPEAPPRSPAPDSEPQFQPSVVRTFTGLPEVKASGPGHSKQNQRIRLARRAFLRHSFNRLDLIAVVSYWISLSMQLSGYESEQHVYIFNMLSSLRILRLLGLTAGTSIILRSLKRAAPLLVHVAFLISFFWLIFGIVGVQSFKSSLRRTCVWVGDDGSGENYTQNLAPDSIQFCGGYLDINAKALPWLKGDGRNGTSHPKGFLCPIGSLCVENAEGPYNGTIGFDNIAQSLEMAFVIMSSNTFSDIMYYLTDSDYLTAAFYYVAGIIVLSFWLLGLLIAVITSSFQIIREESRRSAFQVEPVDEPEVDEQVPPKVSPLKRIYDKTHLFWVVIIAFDLIVQSLRSANMSDSREAFIMNTETAVTFLLAVEIIVRFACDWRHFHKSKRNWVDLFLVVVTLVMQVPPIRNSEEPYAWLTTFQIARIYRIVIAIRVTRELLFTVFRNGGGLFNLIVFVFLFAFLSAIMASQLFRGDIPEEDEAGNGILIQFFDIWNSFIGMYQVFSSENWTALLYNVTQFNDMFDTGWLGAMFLILWFVIANLIIMNMFIAVIQESFDVSEDEKRLQQVKAFLKQKEMTGSSNANLSLSSIFKLGRDSLRHRDALQYGSAAIEQLLKEAVVKDFLDDNEGPKGRPTSIHLSSLPTAKVNPGFVSKLWGKVVGKSKHEPNPFYSSNEPERANEDFDPKMVAQQLVANVESRRRAQRQYLNRHPRYNVSLFIFGPHNPFRRICQSIVGPGRGEERIEGVAPYKPVLYGFGAFTYACIVAMVVLACVTTPLYQREYWLENERSVTNWFVWPDVGFLFIFTVEAGIKIVADGFFFTPHAYYRTVWGFIDAIVLITLWINVMTIVFQDDGVSRAVGAFKALRALRLLNISDTARRTFHSIIIGGYKVLAAAFVSLSLLVPFAILGVNLFNGKMEECNDGGFGGFGNLTNCVGEYNSTPFNWPVLAPRQVDNPFYDFDDFGSALFVLFQIASQEGWTDVLESGMSITSKGLQPEGFNSQGNAVYFIIFNLLGAVFILTLFISVFMRNYTEQTGVAFLTSEQRSWLELRKLLKQISPSRRSVGENSKGWRRWCYNLSIKKRGKWQRSITGLLLVHLCILLVEFYPEPEWWDQLREWIFLLITLILLANIIIRIVGLSWHRFRRSTWDLYSTAAVFGCLATSIMRVTTRDVREIDMLHKLFMVSLVFLLIPRNNQLDQLLKTAAASFPLILNLLATWFVLFLVFAIALTQTFSLTRFGEGENSNTNFRDVPKALTLLFRMSIGEGWNQVMEDFATIEPPFCVTDPNFYESDCGSASWARALFVAWNIISMYIFVSLFVSLIFESFSYVYQRSSGLSVITRDEIRRFKHAWADFDPRGTGYISKENFPRLLGELSGVFQMRIYDGDFTIRALMEDCSVEPGEIYKRRRVMDGIDIDLLNARLRNIPVDEIRMRKQRMEVFYQDVMLSADPDRGISFTTTLMTLAQYNVIEDSRSLRLEEFLRRRARLQRVHESIRRNVVVGFFDTIYCSRKFRDAVAHKRNSRMGAPPSMSMPVPEIFVEDPDETSQVATEPQDFLHPSRAASGTPSPSSSAQGGAFSSRSVPKIDTSMASSSWARDSPLRTSFDLSPTTAAAGPAAVESPRPRLQSVDTSYHRPGMERVSLSLSLSRTPPRTPTATPGHSRQNSDVGGAGVMESFDNSAWGESIRRNLTTRGSR